MRNCVRAGKSANFAASYWFPILSADLTRPTCSANYGRDPWTVACARESAQILAIQGGFALRVFVGLKVTMEIPDRGAASLSAREFFLL